MNSRRVERVGRREKSQSKPPHSAKWLAMSKARSQGVEYLRSSSAFYLAVHMGGEKAYS